MKIALKLVFFNLFILMSTHLAGRRTGRALWPPVWQCWTRCSRPEPPVRLHLTWPLNEPSCRGQMQHDSQIIGTAAHIQTFCFHCLWCEFQSERSHFDVTDKFIKQKSLGMFQ